jgi:hypothetical protein
LQIRIVLAQKCTLTLRVFKMFVSQAGCHFAQSERPHEHKRAILGILRQHTIQTALSPRLIQMLELYRQRSDGIVSAE